jgi:chloramphenicol O-acetyltransferase type A
VRQINLETWPRRDHFRHFNAFDYPHFSLCANVDVTAYYPAVRQRGISFTVATVYILARAANAIPEFRYRIRSDAVVEHDIVHPSPTIIADDGLFTFCPMDYIEDFTSFADKAAKKIAHVKAHPTLKDVPGQDNLLFMTAVPWVSFTSITSPLHLHPTDSVPRIAWGKFFEEGGLLKMPLSVQAHHALMDGIHMGRFYEKVQDGFRQPECVLALEDFT